MSSEMIITFPGNKRVDASFGGFTIRTDQPPQAGGDGSAPTPYATFLASMATCAGIFVLGFCQQRGIPTDGIRLVQRLTMAPGGGLEAVGIDIEVPPDFPGKYLKPVAAAAAACSVKKTILDPPEFRIQAVVR